MINLTDFTTLTMPKPTRLLVLLNPFSGPGEALAIYHKRVVPMFAQARLDYQLIITGTNIELGSTFNSIV